MTMIVAAALHHYPRLLAVAGAGLIAWGCATAPVTGRSQLMLVSEQQAIEAGSSFYVQEINKLRGEGKLNTDARELQRLRQIASRIIPHAINWRSDARSWDWKVNLIQDDKTVNAYCTAGGGIAFYTGLLRQLNATDDEVAQVMGHEVAHALASHTRERMSIAMASNMAAELIASTRYGASVGSKNVALVSALTWQLPNSRTGESEADRIGIELAARAGYNPAAAVSLWQKMARASGGGGGFSMLSTHPSSSERIAALQKLVPAMMPLYEASQKGERPLYPLARLD